MTTVHARATIDEADLRRRLPPTSANLSAPVGARVEIIRDRAGVPHMFASSTRDVYFGLGFAMAQDRLWQMDRLRRRALGRQAEILGAEYVQSDLLHRAVGIPQIAETEVERCDPATRAILEAFVAGINRHIEACGRELPIEFALLDYEPEPFSMSDSIAILRGEWWSLNGRLHQLASAEAAECLPTELRAAFLTPEAPEFRILASAHERTPQLDGQHGMGDATGSNDWAVAGSHTSSGRALLCSDPHQPFWVPSSWYEYAVHGPEDDAAGAGHPGVPGLWFGSNGTVAWGITNNAASARDVYREEVHPNDPHLYRDGDTWRPFEERLEEVQVRGGATVRHVQRSTVRGPIVNHVVPTVSDADAGAPPLALRWVGQEHLDDVRAAIAIGRSRDWESFRDALRDWSVAVFNFGYADASGRVGYQCAGRVPIRGRTVRGYRDANEPADRWQGYIPFEALPHMIDPPRGYIASANERVAPDDYPYALQGAWGSGHRAARIHQVLANCVGLEVDQSIALQNDLKSCRAERLCPPLLAWLRPTSDPEVLALIQALAGWNYGYTLESPAPTFFETFMDVWQARVARERFPEAVIELVKAAGGAAAHLIEHGDDGLKWFGSDLRGEIQSVARTAVESVRRRYGSDPAKWQWGKVHQAYWHHPLGATGQSAFDIGPAPVDGGPDCLRNTGAGQATLMADSGAEYRLVVDFAEPDRLRAVQNIGNSGQPGSPHYSDQFEAWLAGRYHTVNLRREPVERDAEGVTLLEPVRAPG